MIEESKVLLQKLESYRSRLIGALSGGKSFGIETDVESDAVRPGLQSLATVQSCITAVREEIEKSSA